MGVFDLVGALFGFFNIFINFYFFHRVFTFIPRDSELLHSNPQIKLNTRKKQANTC